MEQTQHKKVGIIGGMGPLATADLFEKITHLTKADADSQHTRPNGGYTWLGAGSHGRAEGGGEAA